jgi:phage/conjugal plasmid C-4 type zinc finger TraR family protein
MSNDVVFDTMTDVADEADLAFIYEQSQLNRQLQSIAKQVNVAGVSLEECEECGAEIPLKRQQAIKGCRFCVDCQSDFERKSAARRF